MSPGPAKPLAILFMLVAVDRAVGYKGILYKAYEGFVALVTHLVPEESTDPGGLGICDK